MVCIGGVSVQGVRRGGSPVLLHLPDVLSAAVPGNQRVGRHQRHSFAVLSSVRAGSIAQRSDSGFRQWAESRESHTCVCRCSHFGLAARVAERLPEQSLD